MRSRSGLDGRSLSGVWVIRSSGRLVGPFNGYAPTSRMVRELRRAGFDAEALQLWSPAEIRDYIDTPRPVIAPVEAPADDWPEPTEAGQ